MDTITLQAPENSGGFTHQGVSYAPDKNGQLAVPPDAAVASYAFGFIAVASPQTETQAPAADSVADAEADAPAETPAAETPQEPAADSVAAE